VVYRSTILGLTCVVGLGAGAQSVLSAQRQSVTDQVRGKDEGWVVGQKGYIVHYHLVAPSR